MPVDKFRLLFFGSDVFSIRVLKHLLERRLCPIQVITKSHSLLDKFSAQKQLIKYNWPHDIETINNGPNIGLVASFGSLIDETTVNKFKYGLFNVHPSLLPKYRGSTPVQAAIFNGDKETGCTIMRIPPIAKFDVGEIILQQSLSIRNKEYALELRDRLADLGAELAEHFLLNYDQSLLQARPQSDESRSYAKKLKPEQGRLNFRTDVSDYIDRKVRAYSGFIDLFIMCLSGLKVRLDDMKDPVDVESYDLNKLVSSYVKQRSISSSGVIKEDRDESGYIEIPAGTMFFHKIRRLLCIKCADARWLAFGCATPESKSKMSAMDFYNGYLTKVDLKSWITDT